ncbi:hypothetical protein [Paraburkholderia humisilvae]|uniref:Uncharacterized protein n=1 Tax=Paraburkholderia humisilvae TaxID=627669 RepID=A0A6J5DTU5_9BURK|nr:hypothetical protein [Paraburkholderia humisilvae]CAB3757438.1 hypothetical protein LMG29542_03093 [Paraburkholderia humisilvae]
METQTYKLARIATVVCGSMAPFAAHAQQVEPIAEPATQTAGVAAGVIAASAQPDAESVRESANLPIVDATQTDAQCVTDAVNARSVPVSYAAPIAVPGHTDTVADMSTQTAAPVVAEAQANELEWGEPRADAAQLADAGVPSAAQPAPLEDAARVDGASVAPHHIEASPPRATHADEPAPAKPVLLLDVQRPVRKAPVSYAVPIAVPVHTAQTAKANDAEPNAAEAAPSSRVVARTDEQTDAPTSNAAQRRHVSYAAPVAVSAHGSADAFSQTLEAAPSFPQAKPFALAHVKSSDVAMPSPRADSRDTSAPAALPAPQAKPPISYAAPIAAPSRKDSSATGNQRAQPAQAGASTEDPKWSMPEKVAISDERLDKMRGGFDLSSGLKVSFGISRMVVVNGNLVTTMSFNIPDISNINAQQAQQLASINAGALIQNGPGNVVQPGALPALSGAVIQNTLSNQQIQALTTINTTVNSLSMFKNLNIGSTLSGALINSVRGQ